MGTNSDAGERLQTDRAARIEAGQRGLRRALVLIGIAAVVGLVVGILGARYGWFDGSALASSDDGPLFWVGFAISMVGLAIEVWAVVRIGRRAWREAWNSPMLGVSKARRTRLQQQLRGQLTLDPATLPEVVWLAEAAIRQYQRLVPVYVGLMVMTIGQGLSRGSSLGWLITLTTIVLFTALVLCCRRDSRRAHHFLADRSSAQSAT